MAKNTQNKPLETLDEYKRIILLYHPFSGEKDIKNKMYIFKILYKFQKENLDYLFKTPIDIYNLSDCRHDLEAIKKWYIWLLYKCDELWIETNDEIGDFLIEKAKDINIPVYFKKWNNNINQNKSRNKQNFKKSNNKSK